MRPSAATGKACCQAATVVFVLLAATIAASSGPRVFAAWSPGVVEPADDGRSCERGRLNILRHPLVLKREVARHSAEFGLWPSDRERQIVQAREFGSLLQCRALRMLREA